MKKTIALSTLSLAIAAHTHATEDTIEEILVSADFRAAPLQDLSTSASVIAADTIAARGAEHLADILNIAPNVNFSTGASRGRFFQIRGIGERSQFIEPVNPSVGLLIDGIDLTGIGAAATTLDIQQVEILRGPQGTLYGANALAGLINMASGSPSQELSGNVSATVGEYNTRTASGVISGPISHNVGFRVALEQHTSDGYQDNAYLNIDDNANIDEQTLRGKLAWQVSDSLALDVTGLYVNIDNGYDGFSLDNTRTTLSDQPGHDRQETAAFAVKANWQVSDAFHAVIQASNANSDTEYGYDEDWAYTDICVDFTCIYDGFTSFDNYQRDINNTTLDVRLVSDHTPGELGWVAGAYYRDQAEDLHREYTYLDEDFLSDFNSDNSALYGQLEIPLSQALQLITGLRVEQREASYRDSDGVSYNPSDDMLGGKVALEYRPSDVTLIYALASRGYKAGGFNSNSDIPAQDRVYDPEFLWNYETGLKTTSSDGRLQSQIALFYQDRDDLQTKQSLVQPDEGEICPCSFIDYTTNATAGITYGLEAEINWQAHEMLSLFASLGLLRSEFKNFASFAHAEATEGAPYNLDGHDLPHAPRYQFTTGAVFNFSDNWYARIEIEGKDGFYFSSRHEAQADSYELLNARIGYQTAQWEFALYGRNLTDEDTQTRGFGSFGNDPRDGYTTKPYYQFGEPRMVAATASYRF
ncbi:TonB-dependent receptor [Gilvimarinus polysaccharolyticus]|uniref:TonB-dependent receptor n=1 Tax=Gilvimarinus polysaccharolyticus TaxID=863921 RepID=UPI0006737DD4|nr:TonB-dependent receptor [Gilvimarinus polysaccharolyticus]